MRLRDQRSPVPTLIRVSYSLLHTRSKEKSFPFQNVPGPFLNRSFVRDRLRCRSRSTFECSLQSKRKELLRTACSRIRPELPSVSLFQLEHKGKTWRSLKPTSGGRRGHSSWRPDVALSRFACDSRNRSGFLLLFFGRRLHCPSSHTRSLNLVLSGGSAADCRAAKRRVRGS